MSPASLVPELGTDLSLTADPHVPATAVIQPLRGILSGELMAQPSKNYTTRYLLAAALAEEESVISNCATSDDSEALQRCLVAMGCGLDPRGSTSGGGHVIGVRGFGSAPHLRNPKAALNVGNAGAVLRMLLGVSALMPDVTFETSHPESLGKRPNADLLKALTQLGCACEPDSGLLPIRLRGGRLHGGSIEVSGAKSSQFLSSLLFLAPLVGGPVSITVTGGLVSKAPVRQTLEVLRRSGIRIQASQDLLSFHIEPQKVQAGNRSVNGDWPGSAALLAAAAATGSSIRLRDLRDDEQGEKASADVFSRMGARVDLDDTAGAAISAAAGGLRAVEFDGDLATDAVLALLSAACFAEGRSRFYGVSNLRIKECDRISEPIAELRKIGVRCWEGNELGDADPDAIVVEGSPSGYEGGIEVDGRGDHRVIMLLAVVGLRCRNGLRIRGAHAVAKSYPSFFAHLAQLGASVRLCREAHQ